MLDVGAFRAKTCSGVDRRAFLQLGTSASLAVGVSAAAEALGAEPPRATSVILLWLWGAPSHLDLFDPKPKAPAEYRGPFSPIATRTPGLQVSELLPQLAARSDQYALVRSMVSSDGGHPGAGTVGLTGFPENPVPVQPNFGSIVARHRGSNGALPPFFYIGRGIPRDLPRRIRGYGGGTMGPAYDPFLVRCSEQGKVDMPGLQLLKGLTPDRIVDRRRLLRTLDAAAREVDGPVGNWNRTHQTAYDLLTRPTARAAFDLTRERPETRARYGQTTFGQSCLLARRLVESGVPYIQVNWSEYVESITPGADFGWDTHIYNFELLQDRHGPIFDRAFSALLDDLRQRGLLDSTLVLAMGEFGRTPRINKRAARDHWKDCYFSVWAGAGVPGGTVIGQSDKLGERPITDPITPLMAGTTLAELTGIRAENRTEMRVLQGGTLIDELL